MNGWTPESPGKSSAKPSRSPCWTQRRAVASWRVINAWPVKYTGPDFNATSSEVAVETLEVAHEGMTRESTERNEKMAFQTEYNFMLPRGYLDKDGILHREGTMRLANAGDEILPLKDPRVQQNPGYLTIILLARVITSLGSPGRGHKNH